MSDNEIGDAIARVALSDRSSFDFLYDRTSAKLFGVAMRILKDNALAEDALQEIYIKVWQKAGSFRPGDQPPVAWLVTIARNHAIDIIRANRKRFDDIDEHRAIETSEPNPEQHAVARSEGERIDRCLEQLDDQKAEAVVSAYVEGYSYQELADRYSIPLNTMRTWLRRSLMALRECLDES